MNIGIIVYSKTNNTLSVAEKLKEVFSKTNRVTIERITAENEEEGVSKNIKLTNSPDVSKYDLVIFGSPVQRFTLCPIMSAYLSQLPSLENKPVLCYITKGLKFMWLGGNISHRKMKKNVISKNGKFLGNGCVCWDLNIEEQTNNLIESFSKLIEN